MTQAMTPTVFFVHAHPLRPSQRRAGLSSQSQRSARARNAVCTATDERVAPASRRPLQAAQQADNPLSRLLEAVLHLERLTRPGEPSSAARYAELPEAVRTPSQMLGRLSPGCEGTAGVFPRCNFSCKPCYHSADSNRVRVDGLHTVTEVARQMSVLQDLRGPTGHCQLIGGEVSLLPAEDHALALDVMRRFGRIPMSFTHGDFDMAYLRRLALVSDGNDEDPENGDAVGENALEGAGKRTKKTTKVRPRFDRLDFAVHFDTGMRGRSGIPNGGTEETDLTPFRARFVRMFDELRSEHGVRSYLAHNMTVTADNLGSLAPAVRDMLPLGFRLLSFQPAAKQGAVRRRVDNLRDVGGHDDGDDVWAQIEAGVGIRLPYTLFQMGDPRCNRMSPCAIVGAGPLSRTRDTSAALKAPRPPHVFPLFDDECVADVQARDLVVRYLGNVVLKPGLLYLKLARVLLRRPWLLVPFVAWMARAVARAGGPWAIASRGVQPITFVMHRFMDADDVGPAWALMEAGVLPDDRDARFRAAPPRVRETVERLSACSYAMARPDEGRVVPACVQHSVYDPVLNERLADELPLNERARPASNADL